MANLSKLKNATGCLKGISITEDYTIEEREIVKKWVHEAKKKNGEEEENSQYNGKQGGRQKTAICAW